MTTSKTYLLELLKETRTRAELCWLMNMSDRQVRKAIEQLRKDGHMIISLEKGYRLAKDMAELETYLNKIHSYQRSLYMNNHSLELILAQSKGQRVVTVRQHTRRLGAESSEGQMGIDLSR